MLLSSTTLDQFTLPSYESAKGSTLIDLNAKVQDVNKKTLADAKAKREVRHLVDSFVRGAVSFVCYVFVNSAHPIQQLIECILHRLYRGL